MMTEQRVRRSLPWILCLVVCLLAVPADSRALTDEELFLDLRLNLTDPGARALGLGGAFTAVADDVTATQANPAALNYVTAPEFYIEYRGISYDTLSRTTEMGSLDVDLGSGQRDLPYLGLRSVSGEETAAAPTLVAFAWPFRLGSVGRRLTVTASRQVLLTGDRSLSSDTETTEARFSFDSFPNTVGPGGVEAYSVRTPVTGGGSAEVVYWTGGASLELTEDFSMGMTVSYATLELQTDTLTQVVDPLELLLDPSHPRLPGMADSDLYRTAIDGTDDGLAWSLGVHWHPDSSFADGSSPWRFGAVYLKGAEFGVRESVFLNETLDQSFINYVVVPDRYSVAASYDLGQRWLFTLEYERIEYSDMMQGFRSGVNYLTSGRVAGEAFGIDPDVPVEYTLDDGDVPRAGVEWNHLWDGSKPRRLAVRVGYFRMPDSRIRMTQFNSTDPAVNSTYLTAFGEGEAQDFLTAGAGYSFSRYSIDLSGAASDTSYQVVGSFRVSFGK